MFRDWRSPVTPAQLSRMEKSIVCHGVIAVWWGMAAFVVPPSIGAINPIKPAVIPPLNNFWFRSAAGRFSIAFPRSPIITSQQDSNGTTNHYFRVNQGNDFYLVSYFDNSNLTDFSSSQTQRLLTQLATNFVKGAEAQVVTSASTTIGRYPGREFTFRTNAGLGKGRIFIVRNRIYFTVGLAQSRSLNAFLNSFRLR